MTLADARRLALALAGAVEAPHHAYTSFRVGGKIFATAPPDGAFLHVFVDENERELAIAMHPECVGPLLWGGKVRGARVELAHAKPKLVAGLLASAWRARAPRGPAEVSRAAASSPARRRPGR